MHLTAPNTHTHTCRQWGWRSGIPSPFRPFSFFPVLSSHFICRSCTGFRRSPTGCLSGILPVEFKRFPSPTRPAAYPWCWNHYLCSVVLGKVFSWHFLRDGCEILCFLFQFWPNDAGGHHRENSHWFFSSESTQQMMNGPCTKPSNPNESTVCMCVVACVCVCFSACCHESSAASKGNQRK